MSWGSGDMTDWVTNLQSHVANCDANPNFKPTASGGDGSDVQFWYVGFDPNQEVSQHFRKLLRKDIYCVSPHRLSS